MFIDVKNCDFNAKVVFFLSGSLSFLYIDMKNCVFRVKVVFFSCWCLSFWIFVWDCMTNYDFSVNVVFFACGYLLICVFFWNFRVVIVIEVKILNVDYCCLWLLHFCGVCMFSHSSKCMFDIKNDSRDIIDFDMFDSIGIGFASRVECMLAWAYPTN